MLPQFLSRLITVTKKIVTDYEKFQHQLFCFLFLILFLSNDSSAQAYPVPSMSAPASGATIIQTGQNPCFSWTPVNDSRFKSYVVTVSLSTNFPSQRWAYDILSSSTTSVCWNGGSGWVPKGTSTPLPSVSEAMKTGVTYYWRVLATYNDGSTVVGTDITGIPFTLVKPSPSLVSPLNGATVDASSQNPCFSWSIPANPGFSFYTITLSTTTDFPTTRWAAPFIYSVSTTNICWNNGSGWQPKGSIPPETPTTTTLKNGTTYYWRVLATYADGTLTGTEFVGRSFVYRTSSSSVPSTNSSSRSSSSTTLTSSSRLSSSSSAASVAGVVASPVLPTMATTPSPVSTIDLARTLPAEFNVTNSGQATYKIPVITAPGSAGLVPNVSLNYSSGGGNGIMGLGWSLSAYGGISRCRQTEGVDGVAKPITWTAEDRFCLNGERLLLVSGTYGASGSTYKTEVDSFSRITAVGGVSGHPDYFTVEYKDGIIETYGNTTDSYYSKNQLSSNNTSTVLDWALSKRSDSAGNKIVFNYTKDTDGQRIDTIDYAFGSTTTRGAYLQFSYESRNDPISGYVAGHAYKTGKRLSGVRSYNATTEIRNYTLTYNQGTAYTTNDKLSRLNRAQECVGSVCSPATGFEWELVQNNIQSNQESSFPLTGGIGSPGTMAKSQTFADINGDKLIDIVWVDANKKLKYLLSKRNSNSTVEYTNGLFTDNGYTELPIFWGNGSQIQVADFNADGRDDVIAGEVFLSTPSADGTWALTKLEGFHGGLDEYSQLADFNGDGLVDIVTWRMQTHGVGNWSFEGHGSVYYLQKGSGPSTSNNLYRFSEPEEFNNFFVYCNRLEKCTYNPDSLPAFLLSAEGDFNGDGRADALFGELTGIDCTTEMYDVTGEECKDRTYRIGVKIFTEVNGKPTFVSYGENQLTSSDTVWDPLNFSIKRTTQAIDLNNDGLSDLIYGANTQMIVRLNTGNGFADHQIVNIPGSNQLDTPTFGDMNGDGYKDIVWVDRGTNITPINGSTSDSVRVIYWNPATNTFESNSVILRTESTHYSEYRYLENMGANWVWKTLTKHPSNRAFLIDFNGDGFQDWVRIPTRDTGSISVKLNSQTRSAGNKIVSFRDGLGGSKTISYDRINTLAHYSRLNGINASSVTEDKCEDVIQTDSDDTQYMEHLCWQETTGSVDSTQFYKNINDPWHYLKPEEQSLRPASPVQEAFGPMPVVTNVETTAPSAYKITPGYTNSSTTTKFSYYYGHAKMQAGGRGFLGFRYFTTVNKETGVRTETEYRQDWPYIGQPRKIKSFTASGHKLSEQENIWGLVNCHDSAGNPNASCVTNMSAQVDVSGTGALSAVQPFLRKSTTKTYALKDNGSMQGDLVSTSIEGNIYDNKGNITRTESTISSGLALPAISKTTVNVYDYSSASWSMLQGRLQRMTVTASEPTYGAITRVSSFTYYPSGTDIGLLNTETVEPDNSNFAVTTTHYYNQGNRYKSVTTADGQTRQTEVAYDSRGRYVDKAYGFFTNGTAPDTPVRQLVSEVISRDKFGTPTESRNYVSSSGYVTKKIATTTFGTPYFTADSTGAFAEIKMGTGADTYGVCPADTKTWATTQAAGGAITIECKDILGRTRRAGAIGFDGTNWSLVDTEYDKLNRVLHVSSPYWRNSSERYWSSNVYDILGRVTETKSPYKNSYVSTTTTYTNLDVEIKNPKNQIRKEKRDLAGQVYEVTDPNNGITRFAYDARGNMREMRDPALNTTTVGYDLRDRKTSMSDPDKGNWVYKYNRFGDLVCQMDGKLQTSVQRYDIAGRMFSRTDRLAGGSCDNPTGTVDKYSQWTYDTAANGLGQLASVYDSTTVGGAAQYQQAYSYDALGRVNGTTTTMPGHGGGIGSHYEKVTYDQYGRLFQTFDAARTSATFTTNGVQNVYNTYGYLNKVVDAVSYGGNQQAYYTVKQMNARGNVTSAEYGNGVTQTADYYPETGLTKILRANRALVSLPIQDTELDWDELGNLDWRHERGTASDSIRRNIREDFDYDNLNRLQTWTSSGDLTANESANYNSIDNITDKTGIGNYLYGAQCGNGTNAGPHALCRAGSTNYFYDKNGNMLNDSAGRAMKYTSYDLPSEITKSSHKTEFSYGPSRARYKRVDTASGQVTTTLYLGSVEKVFYWDGSIQWKRNIAGVGQITQTVNSSGTKLGEAQRYFIKDHLGSIGLISDEIGAVEQSNYFDPWGRERKIITSGSIKQWLADNNNYRITNKPITTRGFTGHEQLAEVGLIHMNGRIYDGALGRFVQADPIIQNPLRIQSLNRYSYVWNNPLNAIDPTGFIKCEDVGHSEKKCTPDPVSEEKTKEVVVTGTKERPKPVITLTLSPGNTSNNAFSGYAFSGQGQTAVVSADIVNKYTDGDLSKLTQKILNKIIASAAARNSLAIVSASAEEAVGSGTGDAVYSDVPCYDCPFTPTPPSQVSLKERLISTFNALPANMGPGEVKVGVIFFGWMSKTAKNFADEGKLVEHFVKHGGEFGVKTAEEYLLFARDIIANGHKVKYVYKDEIRTGYVQLMGNTAKGPSKFAFVGTNNSGNITTLHTKSGKDFWKAINGNAQNKVINTSD